MKMNDELEKAFNKQIQEELNSWYIYKAMASWCTDKTFNGFAIWLDIQADEEIKHAYRLRDYLFYRGNSVTYDTLPKPETKWSKPVEVFKAAYEHEIYISNCIDKLSKMAFQQGDLGAVEHLRWFVTEQEEEEEQCRAILDKFALVGESSHTLYLLDKELRKRIKEKED